MKIGILGTRGIPNHYGGFEQFTEYLSAGLVEHGHDVWVYNSHNHPFKEKHWNGVNLVHCHDPEDYLGIPGQFVYDLNCIRDARNRNFDILLQLGYTSSSVWHRFLPRKPKIVTNMDGLEWQRSKYSKPVRRFLKYAEKLAIRSSDLLIADSRIIGDYLMKTCRVFSTYIPYGADIFETPDEKKLEQYHIEPRQYFLLVARMQPDNHIEEIIKGVQQSDSSLPLLIIGSTRNRYGKSLLKTHASDKIRFLGPLFEPEPLNNLRYFSKLYFHGHSSGGTNPSLLEAMAASAPICAHDNPFSHEVLEQDAFYFTDSGQISKVINHYPAREVIDLFILNNVKRVRTNFVWDEIISAYENVFLELIDR